MNFLIFTGIFPNAHDRNRGVFHFKLAQALSKTGGVRAIAPVPYFPAFIPSDKYHRFSVVPRHDVLDGMAVSYPRYYVVPRVLRWLHGIMVYLSVLGHCRAAVRRHRPDAMLSFFAYPYGFASVLLARAVGLPVIVNCRGSDINHLTRPMIQRRLIVWALKHCDRVTAVSAALKHEIVRLGVPERHVVVLPNGVDVDRFSPSDQNVARRALGLDPERPMVLCVSQLRRVKGIDLLLDAFARLRGDGIRLVIVGDGEERAELEAQLSRLQLSEVVSMVGSKPHDEIPRWMNAADLVVLSSRTEGHPNVLLEAMACGRPVVATGVGGVSEIITSDTLGLVTRPEDDDDLAEGIRRALSREWDREVLRAAAHARTWDQVARELVEIARECAPVSADWGESAGIAP